MDIHFRIELIYVCEAFKVRVLIIVCKNLTNQRRIICTVTLTIIYLCLVSCDCTRRTCDIFIMIEKKKRYTNRNLVQCKQTQIKSVLLLDKIHVAVSLSSFCNVFAGSSNFPTHALKLCHLMLTRRQSVPSIKLKRVQLCTIF
jgi:hypothetical protein